MITIYPTSPLSAQRNSAPILPPQLHALLETTNPMMPSNASAQRSLCLVRVIAYLDAVSSERSIGMLALEVLLDLRGGGIWMLNIKC